MFFTATMENVFQTNRKHLDFFFLKPELHLIPKTVCVGRMQRWGIRFES